MLNLTHVIYYRQDGYSNLGNISLTWIYLFKIIFINNSTDLYFTFM